jgi:hypothetical protein
MPFPRDQVAELLAACHRRCCICHRCCGVKMETDHIVPRDEGGTDEIANAIPVCFECHAEIHGYNDRHPRGRKLQSSELQAHREQWIRTCRERPDALLAASRDIDVGPVQALLDELEFNEAVSNLHAADAQGCAFRDDQFRRAIESGSVSILRDDVKQAIVTAYVATGAANSVIGAAWQHPRGGNAWANSVNEASRRIQATQPLIATARERLLGFLRPEP